MKLERIVIKKRKNRKIRDKIFYSLINVMINDYFRIQEEYEEHIPYEVEKEFTTHLHGAFILLKPTEKEIKHYCRKIEHFFPINIWKENFIGELEKNLEDDGARVVGNNKLILKAGVYAHYQAEIKEDAEISEIIKKYTIPSIRFVGERVTAALAFSIAAKKYVSIISQTIQPAQKDVFIEEKRYSKIGTGKVVEFGPKGLVRMVKLENGDEEIPTEHLLDRDVYIKQYNYEFNKGLRLSSEKYLTVEDLDLLTAF